MYEALDGADALLIFTGWKSFAEADIEIVKKRMSGDVIIDGRNVWAERDRPEGIRYEGIGLGTLR